MVDKLEKMLRLHEGVKRYPYRCTAGKLTIGVGFNLDDVGLYPEEIDFILTNRIRKLREELRYFAPWYAKLDPVRQAVIEDMTYNLGIEPFDGDGFKDWPIFVGQVSAGDYSGAAKNMRSTLWYRQVGKRAERLAVMMETGEWPDELAWTR